MTRLAATGSSPRRPLNRTRALLGVLGLLSSAIGGCTEPSDCTLIALPSIVVTIVDSVSGSPAAIGARGAAQAGSFIDSLVEYGRRGTVPNDTLISLQASQSGPGVYLVTIEKAGYRSWQQANVQVARNSCYLNTANLTAKLRR